MGNVRLSRHFNLYADCLFEDGFSRATLDPPDPRDDMSGYAVVNTTLIAKNLFGEYKGLELRLSVYNLLDKDYTNTWLYWRQIPHDIPRPDRNYLVEVKYRF